ncbi:MAG: hypothetical protein ACRD7E_09985, partial [Bryobacteraceae bacterium]
MIPLRGNFFQTIRDIQGRLWVADRLRAVALLDGRKVLEFRRRRSLQTHRAGPLLSGRNGQLWFLGETIHGTAPALVFRNRQAYAHLDVTAGFEDARGHLWVAVKGRGLVEWIPDHGWERWFPEDFNNELPLQTVTAAKGTVAATRRNLYRLDPDTREWVRLSSVARDYLTFFALTEGGFLASVRDTARSGLPDSDSTRRSPWGVAQLSPAGEVVEWLANPVPSDDYREIQRDRNGRLWAGHGRGIFRVRGPPGSRRLWREDSQELGNQANAEDLEIARDGKLWAGYHDGIAWLDDRDRWHKLPTSKPLAGIRSFTPAAPDVWVAYEQGGRFSRLHRDGAQWIVRDFSVRDGYGPPDTHFLKRDSRGWIWRGSTDGIHISDGRNVAPNDWLHIHPRNGLATGATRQYGFLEAADGSIWISGDQGITRLAPDPSWFDAPRDVPPRIARLAADGNVFLRPEDIPGAFPSAPRTLRIEMGSLHAPAFRDYPFRYRLQPLFSDWRLSRDGTLEFRNLPEDTYKLEVAYAGNGPSSV